MARPISVQLYTLRDAAKDDYRSVLKALSDTGFGYVELAGYCGLTAREFRKSLDEAGLRASGSYCGVLEPAQWNQTEDDANVLGVKLLTNGVGPEVFESEGKLKAAADKINAAVEHFAPKGFTVCLHNHEWEFKGRLKFPALLELCPRACLEADIYWVKTGGADAVRFVRDYADRVRLLHVKDGPADPANRNLPMTAVGTGTVDIAGCLAAAEKGGVEYHVVELDHCATDMLTAVRESYRYLTTKGLATGKK